MERTNSHDSLKVFVLVTIKSYKNVSSHFRVLFSLFSLAIFQNMVDVLFLKILLICLNESCELEVTSVVNWTGVGGVWHHVVRYLNMQDVYANITLL
jgi:hypothetical protein